MWYSKRHPLQPQWRNTDLPEITQALAPAIEEAPERWALRREFLPRLDIPKAMTENLAPEEGSDGLDPTCHEGSPTDTPHYQHSLHLPLTAKTHMQVRRKQSRLLLEAKRCPPQDQGRRYVRCGWRGIHTVPPTAQQDRA